MSYTYLQPGLVMIAGIALGQGLPPAMTWPGLGLTALATVVLLGAPLRPVVECDVAPGVVPCPTLDDLQPSAVPGAEAF